MPKFFHEVKERSRQALNAALAVGLAVSAPAHGHRPETQPPSHNLQINHPIEPPVRVDVSGMKINGALWVYNGTNPSAPAPNSSTMAARAATTLTL